MSEKQKRESKEEKKRITDYRKVSDRHVLILETDLSYQDRCRIAHYCELERKTGNELVGLMKKNYEQLIRTKRYRRLKKLYGTYKNKNDKKSLNAITRQMKEMQEAYHVTWDFCRTAMIPLQGKYGIGSIFALTKAEDIWKGMEKCLYGEGKQLHFAKRGDLPSLRAKQANRGIVLSVKDGQLQFKFGKLVFGVKQKDQFEREETNDIIKYMSNAREMDQQAIDFLEEGVCLSTYRPCYTTLVCKKIRGKLRIYVHITLEGKAKPKYDRYGRQKHTLGKGIIGCDIGTQTIAYTSDTEVGLKNLAERGRSISTNERKERLLYRAMDRSRRAMNPQYYNEDGTIKKGKKIWKNSKRYKKLQAKHKELCRINAVNRHLAINEEVNHIRSLGDTFVTEEKNAKQLQKKAKKENQVTEGKKKRRKRFGRSIKNRCPGYFQAQIKQKFERTKGKYIEVTRDYRASQYDHTAEKYRKKKLSERMYRLSDGSLVQRDWYSSYLLYCIDSKTKGINQAKCRDHFERQYEKEKQLVEEIKQKRIKILNSGIKMA